MVKRRKSSAGRANQSDKKSARGPKLDRSRAPKPGAARRASAAKMREASDSVFALAPGAKKKGRTSGDATPDVADQGRRLNQVLAAAGLGSRRQVEELILDGRVEVDGRVVTNLGVRVNPFEQKIRVDGEGLPKARPTYVVLNKPKNTLCTNNDPSGRRLVGDFMPREYGRLFPVGRLDQNSEGLILLTNDGALAERLTHPRFEVPKKYRVQVAGLVDYDLVNALKRGVHIAEGIVQADEVVVKSRHKQSSVLEITLTEGKNREIRRMLARVGHKVMNLQRIQVGSIKLGKLAPGESRRLTSSEVADLYRMAEICARKASEETENKSSAAPIEVSDLAAREDAKEAERAATKERDKSSGASSRVKNDPNFTDATRKQLSKHYGRVDELDFEDYDDEVVPTRGARKGGARDKTRDPRGKSRRRDFVVVRDEEERTVGPRKFSREEDETSRPARDARRRSNDRAADRSSRREPSRGRGERKTARQPRGGKAQKRGGGRRR